MVSTKILTEAVDVIALTFVLKDLIPPIFQLPYGGSITIAGMVPLLWFALRRGPGWGTVAGILYGLVHIAMGGYVIDPVQAFLDYPFSSGLHYDQM